MAPSRPPSLKRIKLAGNSFFDLEDFFPLETFTGFFTFRHANLTDSAASAARLYSIGTNLDDRATATPLPCEIARRTFTPRPSAYTHRSPVSPRPVFVND